jgi:hypothetical protein
MGETEHTEKRDRTRREETDRTHTEIERENTEKRVNTLRDRHLTEGKGTHSKQRKETERTHQRKERETQNTHREREIVLTQIKEREHITHREREIVLTQIKEREHRERGRQTTHK